MLLPVLLFRHSSPHTDVSSVSLPCHSSIISVLCFAVIENAASDTRTPVVFFNHPLNLVIGRDSADYRSRYSKKRPLVSTVRVNLRTAIEVGAETAVVGSRRHCREHVYRHRSRGGTTRLSRLGAGAEGCRCCFADRDARTGRNGVSVRHTHRRPRHHLKKNGPLQRHRRRRVRSPVPRAPPHKNASGCLLGGTLSRGPLRTEAGSVGESRDW